MNKVFFFLVAGFGVAAFAVSALAGDSPPDQFPGGTSGGGGRFAADSTTLKL